MNNKMRDGTIEHFAKFPLFVSSWTRVIELQLTDIDAVAAVACSCRSAAALAKSAKEDPHMMINQ
jgi:hypothetical protein